MRNRQSCRQLYWLGIGNVTLDQVLCPLSISQILPTASDDQQLWAKILDTRVQHTFVNPIKMRTRFLDLNLEYMAWL